ncbi:MAG: DNA-3-methyladenine glycosylase [Flavobacteriales bacterium]|nr:DNA-3-methyladenine glycosylase [Flavobacteriales bacterium]
MPKLKRSFYLRDDVVEVARDLLGKVLVTRFEGKITSGIICETEAYAGVIDRASHAFGGRRTARNEVMYGKGGTSYVYLCYGIHHLFNVVTHSAGTPHAVLVRAIHPLEGIELMRERRGGSARFSTGGPGTLTRALGIRTAHNGTDLLSDTIHIEERSITIPERIIVAGPRIGVDYAGDDAMLPYRFHFDPRSLA